MSAPSPSPRILSLWLDRLPTDRLERLEKTGAQPDDQPPRVVVSKQGNAMRLVAVNAPAETSRPSGSPEASRCT